MQRPAPGGNVKSAHADTDTISGTSILIALLSGLKSPILPDRLRVTCFCSFLLACKTVGRNIWKREKKKNRKKWFVSTKCGSTELSYSVNHSLNPLPVTYFKIPVGKLYQVQQSDNFWRKTNFHSIVKQFYIQGMNASSTHAQKREQTKSTCWSPSWFKTNCDLFHSLWGATGIPAGGAVKYPALRYGKGNCEQFKAVRFIGKENESIKNIRNSIHGIMSRTASIWAWWL